MGTIIFLILFGKDILKILLVVALIIIIIAVLWHIYDKHYKKVTEKHKKERLQNPDVANELNYLKLQILCYHFWFCSLDPSYLFWYEDNKIRNHFAYLEMTFHKNDNWKEYVNRYEEYLSFSEESKKHLLEFGFGGTDYKWVENNISMRIKKVEYDKPNRVTVFFSMFIHLDREFDRDIVIDALNEYLREISNIHDYGKEFKKLHSLVFKKAKSNETDSRELSASASPTSASVHSSTSNSSPSSATIPNNESTKPAVITPSSAKPTTNATEKPKCTYAPIKPVFQPSTGKTLTKAFLRRESDGKIFNLIKPTVTLGISDCDIQGGYASVHARFTFMNEKWYISNMLPESQEYTYKNKKAVILKNKKEQEINPGKHSYTVLNNGDKIILKNGYCEATYTFLLKI